VLVIRFFQAERAFLFFLELVGAGLEETFFHALREAADARVSVHDDLENFHKQGRGHVGFSSSWLCINPFIEPRSGGRGRV